MAEAPDPVERQGDEADDADEQSELKITTCTLVSKGSRRWFPTEQVVMGVGYIRLSKWDRGLVKLVVGKGLNTGRGNKVDLNKKWFDEVIKLRISNKSSMEFCCFGRYAFRLYVCVILLVVGHPKGKQ